MTKRILLAVTGGIAAYKSPEIVRLLKKKGADVRVILSNGARDFVTPLTLETVSGNPVAQEPFEAGSPMLHIDLARWADCILIAPLSANRLAALAHGFADDLLTTTALAYQGDVWVAPAMNQQMWLHPATVANMSLLQGRGVQVLGPDWGEQACKEVGPGRMVEPETIVESLMTNLGCSNLLAGKTLMITAGPTREPLDPVRFLSNHSSGKMGFALAEQAKAMGARVRLVMGPVHRTPPSGIDVFSVETAQQMYEQVFEHLDGVDIFIGAAAVADYRFSEVGNVKIKKNPKEPLHFECLPNPDILATVAAQPNRPFCVGFAAETCELEKNALKKLNQKNLDMIALNAVGEPGVGFHSDTNALTVYWHGGSQSFELASKSVIAQQLLTLISERLYG